MNDNERSHIDMFDVSENVLVINESTWSLKAVYAALVVIFRAFRTLIYQLLLIAERDDEGIALQKADSRFLLTLKGNRIRRALLSYGLDSNKLTIVGEVKESESELNSMNDVEFITEMGKYHALADTNALALADYDISAGDITAFNDAITDFRDWKADPRTATAQRKSANEELSRVIKDTAKHMSNRMDPAMYLFENDGTSFYADWFNGRILVDPAGPDAQTQNGTIPPNSPQIVNLPFTNLGANKDIRLKCLTPGTNFEVYCSNAPGMEPGESVVWVVNDVISPVSLTTDDLGWAPDNAYLNARFPDLPVENEWEVRVG